jgi:hypothetical protein
MSKKKRRHRPSNKQRQKIAQREITQAHDRALDQAQVRVAADGTRITVFKPGAATGAGDLHTWAQRRNAGSSGVRDNSDRDLTEKQKRERMRRQRNDWLRLQPRV